MVKYSTERRLYHTVVRFILVLYRIGIVNGLRGGISFGLW